MKLSIVIPVYNEQERINKTLSTILNYMKRNFYNFNVIVIDDGSKDDTFKILQEFSNTYKEIVLFSNRQNLGKGAAVRNGVLNADADYIYFTDADLSTPIEEIKNFIDVMNEENCDIVIGSRAVKESKILVHQPIYRELMGKIFNKLVKLLLMKDFNDTQCGAKLFRGNVAKKIFSLSKINGFAFDVEILYIAKLYGYKIKEVPIVWQHFNKSKVHPLFSSIEMFRDLFKIKFNNYKT